MKKLLNLIALGLVSALLVGCMRDGKDGNNGLNGNHGNHGNNGQNAQVTPAGGAVTPAAGAAAAAPVVAVPDYARIIADLRGGKTLSLVIGGGAADTAGATSVADQGLTPGVSIAFTASANGRSLVSVVHSAVAGGNLARSANIAFPLGNPATFAVAFPAANTPAYAHAVNAWGNMFAVDTEAGGAAPFDAAHAYLIGLSSRVVEANGDVTGKGLIIYSGAADLNTANGYTPAPVPFTYTIN